MAVTHDDDCLLQALFSALPFCYQTTATYHSFPSHISRFSEQRINTPPDQFERLLSDRYFFWENGIESALSDLLSEIIPMGMFCQIQCDRSPRGAHGQRKNVPSDFA